MLLRIDTTSSIPVYAQIVDQVKRAIASGAMRGGDSLPSLRETAIKLRVNPLTVNKAYKELEQQGLIETRHGLGSFVAENGAEMTENFRWETLTREIDSLLVDAHYLGLSFSELRQLIEERIENAGDGLTRLAADGGDADEQ